MGEWGGLGVQDQRLSRRVQALDEDKDFLEESRISQDEDKESFQEINKVLFILRVWVEEIFIKIFLINMRINI